MDKWDEEEVMQATEKYAWALIATLVLMAMFALAGGLSMAWVYFTEAMYQNYNWRAEFDGRSVGIHLGIMSCMMLVATFIWIARRVYQEEIAVSQRKSSYQH